MDRQDPELSGIGRLLAGRAAGSSEFLARSSRRTCVWRFACLPRPRSCGREPRELSMVSRLGVFGPLRYRLRTDMERTRRRGNLSVALSQIAIAPHKFLKILKRFVLRNVIFLVLAVFILPNIGFSGHYSFSLSLSTM